MRRFLVFITCELGKTYDVAARIADMENAPMVYSISGEYDLFCMLHLPSNDDIGRFVTEQLQTVPGVARTHTIVCFNPFTADHGFEG